VTLLAVVVEDVPGRWSSVYLDRLGAAPGVVGLGFVALAGAMTLGRFVGDRLVDRWGTVTVVQVSMAVTALALAGGLGTGSVWVGIAAFGAVGLGVATLFPAAMHAAAHVPGIAPATSVAAVSWVARSGFFLAPLAVGALADATSVAWGIGVAAGAAALLVLLADGFRGDTR
jgi:MFS family permease